MTTSQIVKFVGHYDVSAEGKFLWEILCQLRNFGIGRYVTKNEWLRKFSDQPSYMKIVGVCPEMDRWLSRGSVFGEWTFRGHKMGIYEFSIDLNRPDWKLINKHDEKEFLKPKKKLETLIFPDSFPLPPLMTHVRKAAAKKLGEEWDNSRERAPLELCLDRQFDIYSPFIQQRKPEKFGNTPYDETNPNTIYDMWGAEIPTRVDSWGSSRAEVRSRLFKSKLNELTENTEERNTDIPKLNASVLNLISDK